MQECLNSIVLQSYTNWELLAVDDHSSDSSYHLVKSLSKEHSKIKVLRNPKKGIIPALQTAYKASKGLFITRMDADDLMTDDKLFTLLEILKKNNGALATGGVKYFSNTLLGDGYKKYERWLNQLTSTDSNFDEIYKECAIPSPCWMTHRSVLNKVGAFDTDRYPEDYDLAFRFYEHRIKVKGTEKIIHHWRDHADRASRNDPNYQDNRFLDLKLHYYHKVDFEPSHKLVIWGAGKKGKTIAKYFIDNNIPIHWVCNNINKIGTKIYGVELKDPNTLNTLSIADIILAVANAESQNQIISYLNSLKETTTNLYKFC